MIEIDSFKPQRGKFTHATACMQKRLERVSNPNGVNLHGGESD